MNEYNDTDQITAAQFAAIPNPRMEGVVGGETAVERLGLLIAAVATSQNPGDTFWVIDDDGQAIWVTHTQREWLAILAQYTVKFLARRAGINL